MTRAAGCADRGHVGATFNPWLDRTWCLCGERTYPGNVATHDDCCNLHLIACCDHCGCKSGEREGHDDTCANGCNDAEVGLSHA